MSVYVSRHFKYSELACPCCGKTKPIDIHFIYLLQSLRDKLSQPIYITKGGGLRCQSYNKKIGGYWNSSHLVGKAADIRVTGMDIIELAKRARDIGFSRIGLYPFSGFIHVDIFRPSPSTSWVRSITGNYYFFKALEEAIKFIGR